MKDLSFLLPFHRSRPHNSYSRPISSRTFDFLHHQIHGSDPWIRSMDQTHGSGPWIWSMDLTHGSDPWTRPMDQVHGSDPWIWPMDQIHGSDPWIRSMHLNRKLARIGSHILCVRGNSHMFLLATKTSFGRYVCLESAPILRPWLNLANVSPAQSVGWRRLFKCYFRSESL